MIFLLILLTICLALLAIPDIRDCVVFTFKKFYEILRNINR